MGCSCCAEPGDGVRTDFQYAVKIVCGVVDKGKDAPLPPGRYYTKVNIHNFSRCDCVTFRWKVAVGLPRLKVGPVSDFAEATLCPDEALEIDNLDIMKRLGKPPAHVEGWVVIESPVELDVVAVYGAAQAADGPVATFHTERVCPRRLAACDDFDADISTGVAPWQVKGPGPGASFDLATLSLPVGPWAAPPAGSLWVKPGDQQAAGDYTFRLPFKLCTGFSEPSLKLSLLADYYANVFLNGQPVAPVQTGGPNFTTPVVFATSSHFKAGDNEITVVVTNSEKSPVGLAVLGEVTAKNGLCAGQAVPSLPCPEISYEVYTRHFFFQQDGGWWSGVTSNGGQAGTTGQHRRVQAIRAWLTGAVVPGTALEYRAHMQIAGWTPWTPAGSVCGITNQPRRMEAVQFRLVLAPPCCTVGYRVHTRKDLMGSNPGGWSGWHYDGVAAGSTGAHRRIEALELRIDCV